MNFPAMRFNRTIQRRLIVKLLAIASGEGYRLHGVATDPTHLHCVVSWRDDTLRFTKVRGRIKNLLSLDLSRAAGITGRPWFVQKSSRKCVSEQDHLDYLLNVYLPNHRCLQWYEDRGWVNPEGDLSS